MCWQAHMLRAGFVSACVPAIPAEPHTQPRLHCLTGLYPLQGAAQLAPGASLASVNLRITIGSGVPVPVPWTVVLQNPNYVGRVQQARSAASHARCLSTAFQTFWSYLKFLPRHLRRFTHAVVT